MEADVGRRLPRAVVLPGLPPASTRGATDSKVGAEVGLVVAFSSGASSFATVVVATSGLAAFSSLVLAASSGATSSLLFGTAETADPSLRAEWGTRSLTVSYFKGEVVPSAVR